MTHEELLNNNGKKVISIMDYGKRNLYLKGAIGIIRVKGNGSDKVFIEFENRFPLGHNAGGRGKDYCCYWFYTYKHHTGCEKDDCPCSLKLYTPYKWEDL